jgi:hypothetical protein
MARQMERLIRCNSLLTVFQSGFRRHHSTAAAVLKVTEDIRLSIKDGQVTVLLLYDFLKAFDMVVAVQAAKCPELFGWCRYGGGVLSR